jgi:alginate O-acetyltransferase complex protein AlgI
MSITSLAFALFCIVAILVYWRLPARARIPWLFVLSLGFVISWSWNLALILLVVATVNFQLGRWLASAETRRRGLLWIGIGFNLFVLLGLKYSDFYATGLARLLAALGFHTAAGGLSLLVPVGLSFITLQMISYLVDTHHRLVKTQPGWLDFALFVVYFPKLLSGPVERPRLLLPAFREPKALDDAARERNLWLVAAGLLRKVVLADTLAALLPADLFVHPDKFSAETLVISLLAYAFMIYNDFAGYTSIVRGVSGFFGIELTNNFKLPYFARNISEFWDRWHFSLTGWLRDYIFFPSSRALQKKLARRDHWLNLVVPPLLTMLVSGMWHGLAWNYLVWGGLHGMYLLVERLLALRAPKRLPGEAPRRRQVLAALGVFLLVALAWLPFRMPLEIAWQYLAHTLTPSAWIKPNFWLMRMSLIGRVKLQNWADLKLPDLRPVVIVLFALLLDWRQAKNKDETYFQNWPLWAKAMGLGLLVLLLLLLSLASTGAPFVYQGF